MSTNPGENDINNRKNARYPVELRLELHQQGTWSTKSDNISETGAMFFIDHPLEAGKEVDAILHLPRNNSYDYIPVKSKLQVIWQRQFGIKYGHGVKFKTFQGDGAKQWMTYLFPLHNQS